MSEPDEPMSEPTLHEIFEVPLEVLAADPYPLYHRLRAEAPFYRDPHSGAWVATGYADVSSILRDPRFLSQKPLFLEPELAGLQRIIERWMVLHDPPVHTRLRQWANKFFTPRSVANLSGSVEQLVGDMLNRADAAGSMELVQDFAYPLPVSVIAAMLGVPPSRHADFRRWSEALAILSEPSSLATMEGFLATNDAMVQFDEYLHELVREKRHAPGDDLLSAWVLADDQEDRPSLADLVSNAILLLFAGHETTVNLIANGVYSLLRHPDQLEKLRRNPGLIKSAVEEFLRFESPIQTTTRQLAEDLSWGGHPLRKGEIVLLVIGAANRDPAQFADPDRLDITRDDNRHVAFGVGMHFCIGAPLSRLEAQVAIPALLYRSPNLSLSGPAPQWRHWESWRGLKSLALSF